jgi:hypothetical protein
MTTHSEYSKLTLEITARLSKTEKKTDGIFITPRSIIVKLLNKIKQPSIDTLPANLRILEPSAGTGEIANYARSIYPLAIIDAIEFNPIIYEAVSKTAPPYNYIRADFTTWTGTESYDLIVGNPPFVVCKKETVPEQYHEYVVGRPNLFGTFILHSMSMLKVGGILAFIVPASFLNAAYYAKIRNYMKAIGTILSIEEYSDGGFLDTQQTTIGLIYRKDTDNIPDIADIDALLSTGCDYSIQLNGDFIFTANVAVLRELFAGSTTLARMGVRVRTGTVVWNQRKADLTDDNTKTLLIYNTNIAKRNDPERNDPERNDPKRNATGTNKVSITTFKNDEKKQYINQAGSTESVIVVNRGNGNSAYQLSYAFIDGRTQYLVENHLNIIECGPYAQQILASLANEKTKQFVSAFLGNNGLSKTELETIFPIYL